MDISHLHQQRQYILSALSKTQIIMDGLHSKIADAERSLTANAETKSLQVEGSVNGTTTETDAKVTGLGRAQKKKLQQTRWRARTSLRNCENDQRVLFESLRGVQDRILRMQADILDKNGTGWVPPPAAHYHQYQETPDANAVMAAYAANCHGYALAHAHPPANPYAHYPHGIPPSAYLDPETTSDDLWAWQASDRHGPYAALAPSLLSNDPYQYAYLYQNQQQNQQGDDYRTNYDYEWADWDAAGRRFSRATGRLSYGGPGPTEVVDEMGTHHYIYNGNKDKDGVQSLSKDETGEVAPGVFPEKWELGRPSLTVSTAADDAVCEGVAPTSVGSAMKAVLSIGTGAGVGRRHKRVQSAALSPKTNVFVPGKTVHGNGDNDGAPAAAMSMPVKSAFAMPAASSSNAENHAHVHFAEPPKRAQSNINPRAKPFKVPSSPFPFPHYDGNSNSLKKKSQPYTPPHRRNSSLNSTVSASSFASPDHHDSKQEDNSNKRRYSAAAVDLILNRLKENEGKPRKRRGQGQGQGQGQGRANSADAEAGNRRESGSSEECGGNSGTKRGRQGVGWGSVDEPKYKVGGEGDWDVDMEGVA